MGFSIAFTYVGSLVEGGGRGASGDGGATAANHDVDALDWLALSWGLERGTIHTCG